MKIYMADMNQFIASEDCLSAAERVHAAKITNKIVYKRHLVSRMLMRRVLAQNTGIAPMDLEIIIHASGKPYLRNNPLYFNISHSVNMLAVAISKTEVGVDIEYMRERNYMPMAERWLGDKAELIKNAANQKEEFYKWWTAFEAGIKLRGESIVSGRLIYPEFMVNRAIEGFYLTAASDFPVERLEYIDIKTDNPS